MTLDNQHKRLLDQLKTGVLLLDRNLRILYLNLEAEALLEISGNQAPKLTLPDILLAADEDIRGIRRAIRSGTSFTKHRASFRLITGKNIVVDYTINPFDDEGQEQVMMEMHSKHYSQRISRDEVLLSTQATTRELVRGLAHEIKNPLGGIRGAAQLLAQELPDEELQDYTNVIIQEADRLRNLVDRLTGSRKLPEMQPLNIHEVLERVTSLVKAEINDRAIELEKDYDPSIPKVIGDKEQLIQAVLNIVRNAVQALESPSVEHRLGIICLRTRVLRNVTIGSVAHRLVARVEIRDNGPGIPNRIIDTLFYPMISGRADGSGLGLSIAQSIINQHGGIIECDSEPGATVFTLTIPLPDDNQIQEEPTSNEQ
ncbi:MAG: nitrogen regulation protein NR(II) [Gammaproteobacteria bacterium]|nr:PAS domain-containing protein [Pseudomonadales bacterium]MCP5347306.1 PAS domain-containing protein [Pseudomonadales bacterium]